MSMQDTDAAAYVVQSQRPVLHEHATHTRIANMRRQHMYIRLMRASVCLSFDPRPSESSNRDDDSVVQWSIALFYMELYFVIYF